jgi:hypothetical protein
MIAVLGENQTLEESVKETPLSNSEDDKKIYLSISLFDDYQPEETFKILIKKLSWFYEQKELYLRKD